VKGEGLKKRAGEHPDVATDLVVFAVRRPQRVQTGGRPRLHLLLRERRVKEPTGWGLPGAFVQRQEAVEDTAARICEEKLDRTSLPDHLIPLRPFSAPGRDPRFDFRIFSLPFVALVPPSAVRLDVGEDLVWAEVHGTPPSRVHVRGRPTGLVLDHDDIVAEALAEVRRRVLLRDREVYRQLTEPEVTLRDLQEGHEALLGEPTNRDSFRRRLTEAGWLEETGQRERNAGHRPARLFRWRATTSQETTSDAGSRRG
jgi:8-oxo-dGTP diphosphatase